MREADMPEFLALLDDVAALLQRPGQTMAPTARAMFFRSLREFSLAQVRAAFDAHVKDPQRGRFMPLPADLIAQIQGAATIDGRPGAEEAWAIALRAKDENDTVVWTAETAEAWGIARPIIAAGDEVGARMAFRECYVRLVDHSRRGGKPAVWAASLGHDPQLRQVALEAATSAGRLTASDAYQLSAPVTAPLLLMGQAFGAPAHVITSLRELADKLRSRADGPSIDVLERAETMRLQAESAEKVATYAGSADAVQQP